jgi:integral membrane protein
MPRTEHPAGTVQRVKLFPIYKVLAYVVGTLLLVGTAASLCNYLLTDGSDLQQLGEKLSIIWMLHGWVYIAYVVAAFLLSQRAGWKLTFLGLMLLAGLVPGLIFFVERKVEARVRAERPELINS